MRAARNWVGSLLASMGMVLSQWGDRIYVSEPWNDWDLQPPAPETLSKEDLSYTACEDCIADGTTAYHYISPDTDEEED